MVTRMLVPVYLTFNSHVLTDTMLLNQTYMNYLSYVLCTCGLLVFTINLPGAADGKLACMTKSGTFT